MLDDAIRRVLGDRDHRDAEQSARRTEAAAAVDRALPRVLELLGEVHVFRSKR